MQQQILILILAEMTNQRAAKSKMFAVLEINCKVENKLLMLAPPCLNFCKGLNSTGAGWISNYGVQPVRSPWPSLRLRCPESDLCRNGLVQLAAGCTTVPPSATGIRLPGSSLGLKDELIVDDIYVFQT
jgi:hypothetical protein